MYAAIDKALPVAYYYLCIAAYAVLMVFFVFTLVKNSKQKDKVVKRSTLIFTLIKMAVITVIFAFCMLNYTALVVLANTNMPLLTCIINAVVIFFIWRIMISKLGHDFIAARNDIAIADAAGINVDRVRMIAIVLSTAMAGLGQIILLQNLGSFIVYQTHVTIPAYAIAALLIGGATVKSASVKNAIIGNILFQAIYSSAPNAAKMLLGNPQIGEYFRTSLSYGVIAVAIVLYAANEARGAKQISEQAA
jgi:simple sugar transport system permease protein